MTGPARAKRTMITVVLGGALLAAASARGSELAAFNAQVAAASKHQRSAEFYLRTGNAGVAEIELDALAEAWGSIAARFAVTPPDAFADDPAWAEVIDGYVRRIASASESAAVNDAPVATTALGEARRALAELRARNQVRVFTDELDELDAATAHLFEFRREPPADVSQVDDLKARSGVVVYLLRRCLERAPREVAQQPAFTTAVGEGIDSAGRLVEAANRGDTRTVVNVLRELRPIVRMLVLNYG